MKYWHRSILLLLESDRWHAYFQSWRCFFSASQHPAHNDLTKPLWQSTISVPSDWGHIILSQKVTVLPKYFIRVCHVGTKLVTWKAGSHFHRNRFFSFILCTGSELLTRTQTATSESCSVRQICSNEVWSCSFITAIIIFACQYLTIDCECLYSTTI